MSLRLIGRKVVSLREAAEWTLHAFRFLPAIVVVAGLGQIIAWSIDRKAPFQVVKGQIVPPAYPGGVLRIDGVVKRDLSRSCDLEVTQWVEDANGYRHYLNPVAMRADSIRKLEELTPGRTQYAAAIPPTVNIGPAVYHAESRYACNPVHEIWPISIITRISFTVEAAP